MLPASAQKAAARKINDGQGTRIELAEKQAAASRRSTVSQSEIYVSGKLYTEASNYFHRCRLAGPKLLASFNLYFIVLLPFLFHDAPDLK